MARLPRLALAGRPHYVLQRGHNGSPIFADADDRQVYLQVLKEAIAGNGIALHAYALGDTEVRLLVTPAQAEDVSRLMQTVGRRYVAGFNRRHGRQGTLWSGRFKSTVVDDSHVVDCVRHIEGSTSTPMDLPWSSAGHHLGAWTSPLVREHPSYWAIGNTPFDREARYRRLFNEPLSEALASAIDAAIDKGWPLGAPEFIRRLAGETARRLQPLRRGRPSVSP